MQKKHYVRNPTGTILTENTSVRVTRFHLGTPYRREEKNNPEIKRKEYSHEESRNGHAQKGTESVRKRARERNGTELNGFSTE